MSVALPFGVQVTVNNGSGVLTSVLKEEGYLWTKDDSRTDKARGKGAADAIEALLLALACAGVDIQTEQFATALETAVDALAQS